MDREIQERPLQCLAEVGRGGRVRASTEDSNHGGDKHRARSVPDEVAHRGSLRPLPGNPPDTAAWLAARGQRMRQSPIKVGAANIRVVHQTTGSLRRLEHRAALYFQLLKVP